MPIERYYLPTPFLTGHTAILSESEHHHLARVMRTTPGDEVELINGLGELAAAEVLLIEKNATTLRVKNVFRQIKQSDVVLIQALPKLPRLDLIAEKGTELGMTQLWLFPGQRSEKKELNEHQQQRLKAQMISAMKQSGRLFLPELKWIPPLSKWTHSFQNFAFYGEFIAGTPLLKTIWNPEQAKAGVCIVIGPESGFSSEEKQKLQDMGVKAALINENVLRAETAPLAALAIVHHWLM